MGLFSNVLDKIGITVEDDTHEGDESYVELDTDSGSDTKVEKKVIVRPFVLEDFESVKPILDALREKRTIALVNMRPLKEKDIVELKRAINKLKKTVDAVEGEIAGFGEDYIVLCPTFAQVYRTPGAPEPKPPQDPMTADRDVI